jgi:hypothetical protein
MAAKIMCVHGGQVQIIPKPSIIMIENQFVLCIGDLAGSPILGCPVVPNPTGTTKPCTSVVADPINWTDPRFAFLGRPPLVHMPGMPGGTTDGLPPVPMAGLICMTPGPLKLLA